MRSSGTSVLTAGAFLLLCLLWAFGSLRSDLLPGSFPQTNSSPLWNQACILALFAVIAAGTAFVRKANWPGGQILLATLLTGVGLFALPALLIEIGRGRIDDSTRVALFALVPVFTVVLEPYIGVALPQRGGLAAALIALAGTLLIFPVALPLSPLPAIAFCGVIAAVLSVATANCIAVKIAQGQPNVSLPGFAAIAAGSAAIPLAILGLAFKRSASPVAHIDVWAIPDLLALALLFWLMRRMSAVRMTARFLIAPLVANLIALAFLRPGVQARAWLGLLLIALGSGWLLFAPGDEPERTGSHLRIN